MDDDKAIVLAVILTAVALAIVITVIAIIWYCRRRGYQQIEGDTSSRGTGLRVITNQRAGDQAQRENTALITCHFYLRTNSKYAFHSQLSQLGSNPEKQWFFVNRIDRTATASTNTSSFLLTIQPKSDRFTKWTDEASITEYARILNNLFNRLYHPYVEPWVSLDFLYGQKSIIILKQYQRGGSLKDLLHRSLPTADFYVSYD